MVIIQFEVNGWQKSNSLNDVQINTTNIAPPSKIYQLKYNPGLKNGRSYQNCQNRMDYGPIFTVLFSLALAYDRLANLLLH